MQWLSSKQVANRYGLAIATVIGLADDGLLGAVNIARSGSKRKRYRYSEKHLAEFEAARENPKPAARESKASRRTIARPTKDYFAPSQAGAK